ncbi:hypothetical protein Pma05_20560 [Plantactinospora mayteni]|uniref:Secreted protein n=2 Tax=Plantactinospora mayteni TaxID=566021 RepID=A0ABQ4EL62_9ACTN|nr:hypothetical protein Pma05_20560 [Plantactinospora mayteni]
MTLMTAAIRVQLRRSLAVIRVVAVLAGLVGLIFMHQLVGTPIADGHHSSPVAVEETEGSGHQNLAGLDPPSAVLAGSDTHCPPDDPHCPGLPHGHPGQVCQVTAPSHGPAASVPAFLPVPGPLPALVAVSSPQTAANEAAEGSGCGPPSLAGLSIWRI